jgi:hypothetical protein
MIRPVPAQARARIPAEGSGLGQVVLLILAVALLGPAVTAAELRQVLVMVAGVIVGAGAVCVGGLLAWRWRRPRLDAARTAPPLLTKVVRAAPPLPKVRQEPVLPASSVRELPGGPHLHFHGVQASSAGSRHGVMRHTAASWLVQDRVPRYDVQALLGHEDYATTQRYAHLAPGALSKVFESWARRPDAPVTHGRKEARPS